MFKSMFNLLQKVLDCVFTVEVTSIGVVVYVVHVLGKEDETDFPDVKCLWSYVET